MLVDPLGSNYPTPESLQQFFDQVETRDRGRSRRGRRRPGRARCRSMSSIRGGFSFEIVGDPPVDESQRPTTDYQVVSPTYFSTLDLPIVAGRAFDRRDTRDGVPVCIVNEAFARRFHGRSPIGQRVALRPASSPQAKPVVREIVGVARQVKGRPDETEDFVQIYVPMAQDLVRRHLPGRAAGVRPRRGAGAVGPRGDFARRQGAAGQRQRRHDARGHRVGQRPAAIASAR